MWNDRYAAPQYIYGTEPNDFLAEHVSVLESPVLSIGEGEGRNAVFLAKQGLHVCGVDGSAVGLAKAQSLASANGVSIETKVCDLAEYTLPSNYYRSIVSIFAHLPSTLRSTLYPRLITALQPGGVVLLEAYSEAQISRDTGGPKELDMLMTTDKISQAFAGFETMVLRELEREVREGSYHTGLAIVIQFIGRKIL